MSNTLAWMPQENPKLSVYKDVGHRACSVNHTPTMESYSSPNEPISYENLGVFISELRALACHFLRAESRNPTLTPTALVSTALRRAKPLNMDWGEVRWENRTQFFSHLSSHMRRALVDRARHRKARGRDRVEYLTPDDPHLLNRAWDAEERPEEFLILDEARTELAEINPGLAEVIALFYDLRLPTKEIARIRNCCEKTVDRELGRARVQLRMLYKERATA